MNNISSHTYFIFFKLINIDCTLINVRCHISVEITIIYEILKCEYQ